MKKEYWYWVAAILLIAVFALAVMFLLNLLDVLKVCATPSPVDATDDFRNAFELLNASQTSWLTVVGFFATILGLVIPVGSYLLQRQSLKDDAEALKNEVKALSEKCEQQKREVADELQRLRDDREKLVKETCFAIARNYERTLFDDADSILEGAEKTYLNLANFVLQFEHALAAYVRAGKTTDCLRVVECGHQVSQYLISKQQDNWKKAQVLLQHNRWHFAGLMANDEIEDVLKDYPEELDWVRRFFGQF